MFKKKKKKKNSIKKPNLSILFSNMEKNTENPSLRLINDKDQTKIKKVYEGLKLKNNIDQHHKC